MIEIPPRGLEIAAEIGQIAATPGRVDDHAVAVLDALRGLVPYQAAAIVLLDPGDRTPVTLTMKGYDDATASYIESRDSVEEFELLGLTRDRRAMRVRDLPVPLERVRGWVDYLRPAGFRGGMAVGLFSDDGRHLGILGLNTDSEEHPTTAARDLLGLLAPLIAAAVDPMRSMSVNARLVHDAEAGVVLDDMGGTAPLPGLAAHPLLAAGSAVLAVAARRLSEGPLCLSFLCPVAPDTAASGHVRVTVLGLPANPFHASSALVIVSPTGHLDGLTRRELEVLGLIIEGWPNQRIAAALLVAERTVAAHVEHILVKLGAPSRTHAAVRAIRTGMYVPRELFATSGGG